MSNCPFYGQHFSRESVQFLQREFEQMGATTEECQKCPEEEQCKKETERTS